MSLPHSQHSPESGIRSAECGMAEEAPKHLAISRAQSWTSSGGLESSSHTIGTALEANLNWMVTESALWEMVIDSFIRLLGKRGQCLFLPCFQGMVGRHKVGVCESVVGLAQQGLEFCYLLKQPFLVCFERHWVVISVFVWVHKFKEAALFAVIRRELLGGRRGPEAKQPERG